MTMHMIETTSLEPRRHCTSVNNPPAIIALWQSLCSILNLPLISIQFTSNMLLMRYFLSYLCDCSQLWTTLTWVMLRLGLRMCLICSFVLFSDSAYGHCISSIHSNDQEGYLASQTTRVTSRGSQDCPWIIDVHRGQHIDLYVIDLSLNLRYNSESVPRTSSELVYCHLYATVTDGDIEFSVCASNRRHSLVYTSQTSRITVELSQQLLKDENILLRYVGKKHLSIYNVAPSRRRHVTCSWTSRLICY